MSMTVGDLLAILEELDETAEVRIAHQPEWPFEYEIDSVFPVEPEAEPGDDADDEPEFVGHYGSNGDANAPVVYLVDGRQLGYLPSGVARQIGWRG